MTPTNRLRFAPPFSDHAVLQRDRAIPIWGTAEAHERVTVDLAGSSASTISDLDGHWIVHLPPCSSGGPYELAAKSESCECRIRDVLIGEVWIASGQSNMEWKMMATGQSLTAEEFDLPGIRLLTVNTPARLGRQTEVDGRWTVATKKTLANFSAVAAWFGYELHRKLGVPVGLICNASGGTRIQAWMSREALMLDPDGRREVARYEDSISRIPDPDSPDEAADWNRESLELDAHNQGFDFGWASPDFDDSGWKTMALPARWQDHGYPGSGVFWFRRQIEIPASWLGRELELELGAIDKHDDTYVQGVRIGGLSWNDGEFTWCTPRTYQIPANLVRQPVLQLAVRVRSHSYLGGLVGPASSMKLTVAEDSAIPLEGEWRYRMEQDWGVRVPPDPCLSAGWTNAPYTLFDSRLAPLLPYGLRGVIWYQGEANVSEAGLYRRLLPGLIADWRRAFCQGDLPFLQVQLATFLAPAAVPQSSRWAELREAQATALSGPGVGMAAAIDAGEEFEIHPHDKRTVGGRLARWALATTYEQGGDPCGPAYSRRTLEKGGRIRIHFTHASGLRTRGGDSVRHVAIAGADHKFVWAECEIEGETLLVWSPQIEEPAAVRYAWADNPEGCNLIGGTSSLPAFPFRTDDW